MANENANARGQRGPAVASVAAAMIDVAGTPVKRRASTWSAS
jgi:hypothetical protein